MRRAVLRGRPRNREAHTGMAWADVLVLAAAGVGAGVVGSTAGLASLISFPALLALGLPPVAANVTNTVALIGSSIGSVSRSRGELRGQRSTIRSATPIAMVGGAAGAALLLTTPSRAFESVVPFLIALASVLLLLGPRLRTLRSAAGNPPSGGTHPRKPSADIVIGLVLAFVYGGYFGAAAGVMVLALLLLGTDLTLPRATALRNVLVGTANATAAVGFAFFGDVRWFAVLPLGLGCIVGGAIGPGIVRSIPPTVLRVIIGCAGLALAVKLWMG